MIAALEHVADGVVDAVVVQWHFPEGIRVADAVAQFLDLIGAALKHEPQDRIVVSGHGIDYLLIE